MKALLSILTILVALTLGTYFYLRFEWGPYGTGGVVYIPKGYSVGQIGGELSRAQIIRNAWSFKLLVRLKKAEKTLKAGEYEFPPDITAAAVLEKIRKGERLRHTLTIPEGASFSQIAALIAKAGIASEEEVRAAFKDPHYLRLLGFPAISLEGYLFPDTYEYVRETTLEDLLKTMIQNFKKNFDPELRERAREAGWTIPQVVTLASIIEKETAKVEERPLISSVFENRLRLGMPLQSDPTVIYGLTNFDGNLRKEDLRNLHLFNTYVHTGLPPGPIASPGKESLRAVLYPRDVPYLYFVSRGDGTHQFSATLEEHNAAVRRFQSGQGPIPSLPRPTPLPETNPSQMFPRPLQKPLPMPRVANPGNP